MNKTAPVLEPPSLNRASTAYKYIRLSEKATERTTGGYNQSSLPCEVPGQLCSTSLRDYSAGGQSTGLLNVNGGDMTSRKVALEPASLRNDLSITFVPCGYLRCTQCYEFSALGESDIARPMPNGFIPQLTASDVGVADMSSSSTQWEWFKESDYDNSSTSAENTDKSGFPDLRRASNGTPCIGNVVQGNLIGAGKERGDHEDAGMEVVSDHECGSDSDYTLSDASTPCTSGDEYVPPQTATNRKARRTAVVRSKRRSGYRR